MSSFAKNSAHFFKKYARLLIVGLIIILVLMFSFPNVLGNVREDIEYRLDPSATHAFQLGERHFSSIHPADYDLDRAEHFFNIAALKDPTIPYLYHELARVSFLRGDFEQAMGRINLQIQMHGTSSPNSYYVRGLIEGYNGDYDAAVRDYAYFRKSKPDSWAGANDYAWVLLKAHKPQEAADVTGDALKKYPGNAWLLSTRAVALYEIGDLDEALRLAKEARVASANLTEGQWLVAYPGNDPRIAREGMATHLKSIDDNIHSIEAAIAARALQSE